MSFHRRFVAGMRPLLVWAETDEAADLTATIHAEALGPMPYLVFLDPGVYEFQPDDEPS